MAGKAAVPPATPGATAFDAAADAARKAIDGLAAGDAPAPLKALVRLSIRPGELTEVHEGEVPGLRAQGLLIEEPAAGPAVKATPVAGKDAP